MRMKGIHLKSTFTMKLQDHIGHVMFKLIMYLRKIIPMQNYESQQSLLHRASATFDFCTSTDYTILSKVWSQMSEGQDACW